MVFRPMWKCCLPLLVLGALNAASIRGTVVENLTGRPLARALIEVTPLPGTPAQPASTRTNVSGVFEFPNLAPGPYLLSASRPGFATVQYGQKHWNAAALPVQAGTSGGTDLVIRLPRFGAITGAVLDENQVGLPEHDVVAYRAGRPLQLAARVRTDDRGRYRLSGLEPGKYLVRTVARQYDDTGFLPTFHGDTVQADQATVVDVELDRETTDVDIHPAPGRLVTLSGKVVPPAQIDITLVSNTGAENTVSDPEGNFEFRPAAPGQYELYAQAPADRRLGIQAAYLAFSAYGDRNDLRLPLRPLPQLQFNFQDSQGRPIDYRSVRLIARRKDLAGTGKPQTLELASDQLAFLPGRWELTLAQPPGFYVSRFFGPHSTAGEPVRGDGWNEVLITGSLDRVQFVLSPNPGAVHGRVIGSSHEPAPGAPVYLESLDSASRRPVRDNLRWIHADAQGQYRFADLAPGNYRVFSSLDFEPPNGPAESRSAKTVHVEEARDVLQDLELF